MMGKGSGMLSFGIKKKKKKGANWFVPCTVMDEAAQNNIQLKRQTQRSWLVITATPGWIFLDQLWNCAVNYVAWDVLFPGLVNKLPDRGPARQLQGAVLNLGSWVLQEVLPRAPVLTQLQLSSLMPFPLIISSVGRFPPLFPAYSKSVML